MTRQFSLQLGKKRVELLGAYIMQKITCCDLRRIRVNWFNICYCSSAYDLMLLIASSSSSSLSSLDESGLP